MRTHSFLTLAVVLTLAGTVPADDLPPDAKKVLADLEKELQAIQAKADAEASVLKAKAAKELQVLRDKYTRNAMLDEAVAIRNVARALSFDLANVVIQEPVSLSAFRGATNKSFHVEVTGDVAGIVWGDQEYADDSSLATAAVHAGVLKAKEKGVVRVTILPGRAKYEGSERNGVTTKSFESFPGSFKMEAAPDVRASDRVPVRGDVTSVGSLRGNNGKSYVFLVLGRGSGTVFGTDTYSDDSDVATAAVHAGLLKAGQLGLIKVTIVEAQQSYLSTTRHGVTTLAFGQFGGSYRLELAK